MQDRKSKLKIEIKNVLGKYIGQGKFNQGKILRDKKKNQKPSTFAILDKPWV